MKKERLDVFLTEQGFFESRSKAQAVIMAGEVLVNDQKIDKPGTMVTRCQDHPLGEKDAPCEPGRL